MTPKRIRFIPLVGEVSEPSSSSSSSSSDSTATIREETPLRRSARIRQGYQPQQQPQPQSQPQPQLQPQPQPQLQPQPQPQPQPRPRPRLNLKISKDSGYTSQVVPARAVPAPPSIHANIPLWTPPTPSLRTALALPGHAHTHAQANQGNEGMLTLERFVHAREAQDLRIRREQQRIRVQQQERLAAREQAAALRRQETGASRPRRTPAGVFHGPHPGCGVQGVHRCGGEVVALAR